MTQNTPLSTPPLLVKDGGDSRPNLMENHLSSSAQLILKYEERNFDIEDATKSTSIPKELIQNQMEQPLEPSTQKVQQLIKKYGTMIENQPMFMRQLIYENYLPYLPTKFKVQFSEVMMLGGGFEAVWWGAFAFVMFRAYRYRKVETTLKQKTNKLIGATLIFVLSSLGFHNQIYIPKMKKCFYRNIKSVDTLINRHVKILESCGKPINQQISVESIKNQAENVQKIVAPKEMPKKEQMNKK